MHHRERSTGVVLVDGEDVEPNEGLVLRRPLQKGGDALDQVHKAAVPRMRCEVGRRTSRRRQDLSLRKALVVSTRHWSNHSL